MVAFKKQFSAPTSCFPIFFKSKNTLSSSLFLPTTVRFTKEHSALKLVQPRFLLMPR